ncbi:squalene synthase HpnC [bacterium]|nr:squalene synthase HpnC [bacterium]MBU1918656.1 squalene synthase HpnC [bacterium]
MQENAKIIPFLSDEDTQNLKRQKISPRIIQASYAYCASVTKDHYENFPVASVLVPKKLRPAVQAIYAFSRMADDFADEKEFEKDRMIRLEEWDKWLHDTTRPTHPVFIALHDAMREHNIPIKLLQDLLEAFKMDVTKNRYDTFSDVLYYCQHSANPVGRLVLTLFGHHSGELMRLSDYICTALQLTNFWQDIAIDLKKNRIYLPQDELYKFDVPESSLFNHMYNTNFRRLMQFQWERTRDLFMAGKPLGLFLPKRLGLEIRLTWLTGITILKRIKMANYDIFNNRPTLTKIDFMKLYFTARNRKIYEKFKI